MAVTLAPAAGRVMMRGQWVTLNVAAGCTAVSLLAAGGMPVHPLWTAWLAHPDVQHLVTSLLMWVIFGLWIERRAGSLRLAAWTVAGVGASLAAHAVMHPEHDLLLGLSAVLFVVCTAGLTGYALDEWPGRVALLGVVAVLVHERLSGGTIAADMFSGVGWGEPVELVAHRGRAEPVPDVHLACALVGVVLGVLCRVGKPEKLACRRGPRGSGAAVTL